MYDDEEKKEGDVDERKLESRCFCEALAEEKRQVASPSSATAGERAQLFISPA